MKKNDEFSINVKDLAAAVLFKWRIILLAGILAAALCAGWQIMKSRSGADVESSDEIMETYRADLSAFDRAITGLRELLKNADDYLEGSLLMKINPNEKAVTRGTVEISLKETGGIYELEKLTDSYISAAESGSIFSETAKKWNTEPKYIVELVTLKAESLKAGDKQTGDFFAEDTENAGAIKTFAVAGTDESVDRETYTVRLSLMTAGSTEEDSAALFEDVKNALISFAKEVGKNVPHDLVFGEASTAVETDSELCAFQTEKYNQVTILNQNLQDALDESRVVEKPEGSSSSSGKKRFSILTVAAAGIGGIMIAALLAAAAFLLSPKLKGKSDPARILGLRYLGDAEEPKAGNVADRTLRKALYGEKEISGEEKAKFILEGILHFAGERREVLMTGTGNPEKTEKLVSSLSDLASREAPDFRIIFEPDLMSLADARKAASRTGAVIFAEEVGRTVFSVMCDEVREAEDLGCEILGYVCL